LPRRLEGTKKHEVRIVFLPRRLEGTKKHKVRIFFCHEDSKALRNTKCELFFATKARRHQETLSENFFFPRRLEGTKKHEVRIVFCHECTNCDFFCHLSLVSCPHETNTINKKILSKLMNRICIYFRFLN
jgi:hypothetical protein